MSYSIDVFSTASSFSEDDVNGKVVVVIDVLRACSTIVTALNNGAKSIIPAGDMGTAGKIAANLDPASFLLCGEKDGIKIEGYQLGNSPYEYGKEVVNGKTLIFSTTNGTKAITKCHHAKKVYIGCFLNIRAVINELKNDNSDVYLICAGWKNRLSLEDMLCAGAIIHGLMGGRLSMQSTDGAKVAFGLYEKYSKSIADVIKTSNHAVRLNGMDSMKDVEYCSRLNVYDQAAIFEDGIIFLSNGKKQKS